MPDPIAEQNPDRPLEEQSAGAPAPSESSALDAAVAAPEAASTKEQAAPAAAPRAAQGGGVLEWFWLGRAMRTVHERGTTLTPRGQELLRRARLASELGARALEPPEPLPSGSGDALACELYRESIEWSLAAHQHQGRSASAGADTSELANRDLAALWDAADADFVAQAAGGAASVPKIRSEVVGRSYRDFAELNGADQTRVARTLRGLAEGLIAALDVAQTELDRLWLKRILRLGLVAIGVAGLVLLAAQSRTLLEGGNDLAKDASWSASSLYGPEPGCPSPQQECAVSPNFFVHTNFDDTPWVMFDLKSPRQVSAVRVDNRLDCCFDRAIPLVVEVSDDANKWREVGRRTTDFSTWKATFDTVTVRYVRVRVDKHSSLHLSRVRILP